MQSKTTPSKSNVCIRRSRLIYFLTLKPGLLLLGLFLFISEVAAQVPIVYYDFEDNDYRNSIGQTTPEVQLAGVSSSPVVRVGTGAITPVAGAGVDLSGGAVGANPGMALSSANWPSGPSGQSDPTTSATEYYQFSFSTTGLADLAIDLDIKRSANGPERWGMLVSQDGSTYYMVGFTAGLKNVGTTYERLNMIFSGGSGFFDNQTTLYFRFYAYKASGAAGTLEIDNLTINAKTITTSRTLLNEADIYTCMTSGATGGLATRGGLKISGAGTTVTMSSSLILSKSLEMDGGTLQVGPNDLVLNGPSITGVTAETGIITTSASSLTIGGGEITYKYKETVNGIEIEKDTLLPALKLPANILALHNLSINRTNGGLLDNNLTVNGALTLTSGNLITADTKKLSIASTGSVIGGNAASFVNGPMSHIVDTDVRETNVFPVGQGTAYRPVTLSVTQDQAVATEYTIEQVAGGFSGLNMTTDSLDNVSGIRHFNITKGAGANVSDADITLTYGTDDQVSQPEYLRVAKSNYNNTQWVDLGRNAGASGSDVTGTITSSVNFNSFGTFALANGKGGNNSLPVELASFTATKKGNAVQLDWTTASEKDNKGFEVQVSANGSEFRALGFVASKNSNSTTLQRYSFTDTETGKTGTRYYRLKQTDLDGTFTYSALRAVSFAKGRGGIAVYPNPFEQQLTIKMEGLAGQVAEVEIADAIGKAVYVQTLPGSSDQVTIQLPATLPKGIYTLGLKTSESINYYKILKK